MPDGGGGVLVRGNLGSGGAGSDTASKANLNIPKSELQPEGEVYSGNGPLLEVETV
jgi:hypothetical protein